MVTLVTGKFERQCLWQVALDHFPKTTWEASAQFLLQPQLILQPQHTDNPHAEHLWGNNINSCPISWSLCYIDTLYRLVQHHCLHKMLLQRLIFQNCIAIYRKISRNVVHACAVGGRFLTSFLYLLQCYCHSPDLDVFASPPPRPPNQIPPSKCAVRQS